MLVGATLLLISTNLVWWWDSLFEFRQMFLWQARAAAITRLSLLAAAAACAQSSITLNADVPFDFIAGGRTLPAGHYTVNQGTGSTVNIRSHEGKGGTFAMTIPACSPNGRHAARLVFHRYGNTYFLSEVWGSGADGSQLPAMRHERQLAAAVTSSSKTIMVSLR